ncbi:hydrolase Nlp/P60 [Paenibacillus selenitireducens]|uniref:Hydrolase Nlp/P60 n=2 Tax=Paenibacillus selenitireducens TaxID=1324314 RepID=A0A1T2XPA8_9BACL|nr:hydrolase Nlp/P60 [Paenibacillus selenitireducens]
MPELEPVTDITAFMSRAGVERAAAGAQNATTKSTVNLRKGPSTSSSILRNLPKGEKLVILGKADSNWYHVQDSQGNLGYLSTASKYTSITGAAKSGLIVSRVNLRTEPSTSSSVIKKLDAGHEVAILKTVNANWLQVWDGQGKVGYISSSSQYIKIGGSGSTTPPSSNAQIEKVISTGMKYLGTPYEFGSNRNSTKTFDCSAFVRQAYKEALGIVLGTDSRKQGEWIKSNSTVKKSISSLKRGDLMFFMSYKGTSASSYSGINKDKERITHVGIYLGDGKILHTYSKASGGVRVDTVKGKHWEYRFLYGGSVLK